jgi:hypothetical protein
MRLVVSVRRPEHVSWVTASNWYASTLLILSIVIHFPYSVSGFFFSAPHFCDFNLIFGSFLFIAMNNSSLSHSQVEDCPSARAQQLPRGPKIKEQHVNIFGTGTLAEQWMDVNFLICLLNVCFFLLIG